MSSSKKRRAAAAAPTTTSPSPTAAAGPDRRPFIYAGLDLVFAVAYVIIPTKVPASDDVFLTVSLLLAAATLAAGVGTAARRPWGWWTGIAGCALLILSGVALITLLAMSAGFLWGVYGALGRGASSMSLVIASLVVEVYILLPAFQLRYLLSPDGRRAVRGEP